MKLCECGCGRTAPIATMTSRRSGWVKGLPKRFVSGHNSFRPDNRYTVNAKTGCWEWQLARDKDGYGRMTVAGVTGRAHRYYFEKAKGPIPDGLHIDHLCRNTCCVNPEHLEAVTPRTNMMRSPLRNFVTADQAAIAKDLERAGVSQYDIAKVIGHGQATVSRVINSVPTALRGKKFFGVKSRIARELNVSPQLVTWATKHNGSSSMAARIRTRFEEVKKTLAATTAS